MNSLLVFIKKSNHLFNNSSLNSFTNITGAAENSDIQASVLFLKKELVREAEAWTTNSSNAKYL